MRRLASGIAHPADGCRAAGDPLAARDAYGSRFLLVAPFGYSSDDDRAPLLLLRGSLPPGAPVLAGASSLGTEPLAWTAVIACPCVPGQAAFVAEQLVHRRCRGLRIVRDPPRRQPGYAVCRQDLYRRGQDPVPHLTRALLLPSMSLSICRDRAFTLPSSSVTTAIES